MFHYKKKYPILILLLIIFINHQVYSGPPFDTDDPEPVDFKHWEYYISSINTHQTGIWTGTSPHIELNYGLIPNIQIHLLMPLNYASAPHHTILGYADTEVGIKYRFVQETDNTPQIGIFPILEIPTVKDSEFSNGKTKLFLPVWMQKSWGKITTYGGAGYWINPGENNRNWVFSGWELQYEFSKVITLGGEVYYHSADTKDLSYQIGFNIGGSLNPSDKFHFIFSFGHTLTNDNTFNSYIGLLWTI